MSNTNQAEYASKVISAEKAVEYVKSGDHLFYGEFTMFPDLLDEALAARIPELKGLQLRSTSYTKPPKVILADLKKEHIIMEDWHFSVPSRVLAEKDLCYYIPITYHQGPRIVNKYLDVDVAMLSVCPMDSNGYFNLGPTNSTTFSHVKKAKKVIVEIKSAAPTCLGGNSESIHISDIDYIVEGNNNPLLQLPLVKPTENDSKIAKFVMQEIEDGACLQLGIGGLPNLIGAQITASDLKDLGIHTEMMVDSFVDMYEAKRITGARKTIDKGKMVYTFAMGTNKLYDFLDNNPVCASYPVNYCNDPRVISLNDKVMAINSAVEVDLFSQVCSETGGTRQISGTGGQLDYIFAAFASHGGKGLICLNSTYTDKEGNIHSRICPTLTPGAVVTVPRSIVQYVVTEYGIVQLKGKSTWERAEALISIAHPELRDGLIQEAQKMHIWVNSNKLD